MFDLHHPISTNTKEGLPQVQTKSGQTTVILRCYKFYIEWLKTAIFRTYLLTLEKSLKK
jgi:CRISPR/Cas system-associated protein Csx1